MATPESSKNTADHMYDLLLGRNFEIETLDSKGKAVSNPSETELFTFEYRTNNRNYGTVVILLDADMVELYFGDNVGRGMDQDDKGDWYDFLYQIRMFAKRNLLQFSLKNISRLKYSMRGMAKLSEAYYGNKKTSYSDMPKKTKLIINHNKSLGPDDVRYRHIESIFVETEDGERFKMPFTKLAGAKAMARHISEGGKPYDDFGKHICELVDEVSSLARYSRSVKRKGVAEDSDELVQSSMERYNGLRKTINSMAGQRGYRTYKESWEADSLAESLSILENTVGKKTQRVNTMKEVNEFDKWASMLVEGTWALPDTPEKKEELKQIMSSPMPVGVDASNASELLWDVIGNDDLMDEIEDLADRDPDADARPVVRDWIIANAHRHPSLTSIVNDIDVGSTDEEPEVEPEVDALPDEEDLAPKPVKEGVMSNVSYEIEELADAGKDRDKIATFIQRKYKVSRDEADELVTGVLGAAEESETNECGVSPFAHRMVEHNGIEMEALVFETTVHAQQYVRKNPTFEHLFTDDAGAYVGRVIESFDWCDLHPECYDKRYLKENMGDHLDLSLLEDLEEYSKKYTTATPGREYIYMSIFASPIHKYLNVARFSEPKPLVQEEGNRYVFDMGERLRAFPLNSNHSKYSFVFETKQVAEEFLTWLVLRSDGAKVEEKILESRVLPIKEAGQFGPNTTDDEAVDFDEYDYDEDDDDEVGNEFYVVIHDEDEGTTFIGGLRRGDNWREFKVAGEAPYNWGGSTYMSYLSPHEVMRWIHKDYERGYVVDGPFATVEQAKNRAREWQPMDEAVGKEYDAHQQLQRQTQGQALGFPVMKGATDEYTDQNQWQQAIRQKNRFADFVEKQTNTGKLIIAKFGDEILGSFNTNTKSGMVTESKRAKKPKKK